MKYAMLRQQATMQMPKLLHELQRSWPWSHGRLLREGKHDKQIQELTPDEGMSIPEGCIATRKYVNSSSEDKIRVYVRFKALVSETSMKSALRSIKLHLKEFIPAVPLQFVTWLQYAFPDYTISCPGDDYYSLTYWYITFEIKAPPFKVVDVTHIRPTPSCRQEIVLSTAASVGRNNNYSSQDDGFHF